MLRFLSSIRLAVILIASLAGLSVSATIYNMPEMFTSKLFLAVGILFFVNLFTCTIKLLPSCWKRLNQKAVHLIGKEGSFQPCSLTEHDVRSFFKANKYAVDEVSRTTGKYFYAVRGRLALLAPHLLHVGILIIMIGAFMSGFSVKEQIQVAQGEEIALPQNIENKIGPSKIKLEEFKTVYDKRGAVENWVSRFSLSNQGAYAAKNLQTSVNHPYKHKALSIYQMAYNKRHQVLLQSNNEAYNGVYVFPEEMKLPLPTGKMEFRSMSQEVALFIQYDDQGKIVQERALRSGNKLHLDQLELVYEKPIAVSVLEIKYSHAMPIVFLGFIIAVIACMMFWATRFSTLSVFINQENKVFFNVYSKNQLLKEQLTVSFQEVAKDKELQ